MPNPTMQLYELCGASAARVFSPYCWRSRMALLHKGLDAAVVPVSFSDKDKVRVRAASGQDLVPVLVDGETAVHDSWDIAVYLESKPGNSLFGGPLGMGACKFVESWVNTTIHPLVNRCVVRDILDVIGEEDKPYFRTSREARFGTTLEDFIKDRDAYVVQLRDALKPMRVMLAKQVFIGGSQPSYADYCLFGAFMWARNVSPCQLLERDDPVYAWRERLLDVYDGYARKSEGFGW